MTLTFQVSLDVCVLERTPPKSSMFKINLLGTANILTANDLIDRYSVTFFLN